MTNREQIANTLLYTCHLNQLTKDIHMQRSLTSNFFAPILTLTLLIMSSPVWAQGTATSPFTAHEVEPGPIVYVGGPLDSINGPDPIPIDLDPTGGPWSKSITDPDFLITTPTILQMVETIINVGDEPWFDWHEHILPNAAGVPSSSTWVSVKLFVNGTPITFASGGLGTQDLWVDTFSQPVLPGDILTVEKEVEAFPLPFPTGDPILRLQEYPTPEPASAALIGLGGLALLKRRHG